MSASDGIPNVGDDPTHVGQRRTPKETSEKSRHEERADVLRARLADIEDGVSAKGEKRNILPPKQLGPGSPQRGAGHVAQKKHCRDKVCCLCGNMEISCDEAQSGCRCGRGERPTNRSKSS